MQQIPCRNCGKPVPADNINIQSAIAKCEACNSVFGINVAMLQQGPPMNPGFGAPPGSMGLMGPGHNPLQMGYHAKSQGFYSTPNRGPVPMPSGITVEPDGKDLLIYRSWWSWTFVFLAIFCIIWDGFLFVFIGIGLFAGGQQASAGLMIFGILSIHILIGTFLTYYTLCGFCNSTTIRAGSGLLSMTHGPLPWWGNVQVPTDDIAQFYTTEQIHRGKKGGISFTYSVEYVLRSGARQTLADGLTDVTQALYIEQELERHLNIQDLPVGGEIQRW